MEVLSKSTLQTEKLAGRVAKKLKSGDILALYGELGSGKTTFTNFLVGELGIKSRVQSPTFVIIRRYKNGGSSISVVNHVDLYRVQGSSEIKDLGLEEVLLEPNSVTVIEWPELVEDLLPEDTVRIYFEYIDEYKRRINVQNID